MLLEHQYTYCWSGSSNNHHNNNSTTISNPVSEHVGRVVPASLWVLLRWHFVTTICCMMQPHITIDSGKWFIRFLKTFVHIQICACVNFRTHCVLIEYDPLLNRGRGHWYERSDIKSYTYYSDVTWNMQLNLQSLSHYNVYRPSCWQPLQKLWKKLICPIIPVMHCFFHNWWMYGKMTIPVFFSEIFFRGGKANRNRGGRGYS